MQLRRHKIRVDFTKVPRVNLDKIQIDLRDMSEDELRFLLWQLRWKATARKKQMAPEGDWDNWGIRSGRGFGKTLTAAQWVAQEAWRDPGSITHVIAPTYDDCRYICFEGPTGLINVIPPEFIASRNQALPSITLKNGSYIRGFAADTPDRLRGPQCHRVWAEEIASWRYPKEAWSNIEFGLRLGNKPQLVWTSTPRPTAFMKERSTDKRTVLVLGSSHENRENLTARFFSNISKYEGTAIGRQEIHGELLDPEEGGFVKRSSWMLWPSSKPLPKFTYLILSLDTAFTDETWDKKKQTSDPTAWSVWGLFFVEGKPNVMLLRADEDHLSYPDLVKQVHKEKELTYGDADEPVITGTYLERQRKGAKPNHQGRKPDLILIEDKGSGISLRQSLAVENILTEAYNPGSFDKLTRLHLVSPLFVHRRVWVPESKHYPGQAATWANDLISQVCTFVGEGSVEHDDLLDTATQALRVFIAKYFGAFFYQPKKEDVEREKYKHLEKKHNRNPYAE
jgi:predicted phage terminase large subunit-like protein